MKKLSSFLRSNSSFLSLVILASASQAHAALPSWASSSGTTISERVTDTEALVGPIIIAVIIAVVTIKLLKRFSSKI